MRDFDFLEPATVHEASHMLADLGDDCRAIAGGTALMLGMRQRMLTPTHLVSLARVPQLRGIEFDARNGLRIGALSRHADVANSPLVRQHYPVLASMASRVANPQVRNQGTIGGSVANNDPAADYPSAVLGLNATVVTTKREIRADDFFQGLFTTALGDGEIIVRIEFPLAKRAAYSRFHHPASGFAMAGVFIAQTVDGIRVAVTGVGPGVFRWKEAEAALAKSLKPAALEGVKLDSSSFTNDMHADRAYRANLVRVMAGRALGKLSGKK